MPGWGRLWSKGLSGTRGGFPHLLGHGSLLGQDTHNRATEHVVDTTHLGRKHWHSGCSHWDVARRAWVQSLAPVSHLQDETVPAL